MSQEELHIAKIEKWINDAVLGEDPSIDFALEVLADPFMQHTEGDDFTYIHAAGPIQYFRNIRFYLDDVDVEIRHIVAQDDMLVWHYTIRGIWAKPFYAASGVVEPTNEEVIIEHIHITRMEDGKIAEAWFYSRDRRQSTEQRLLQRPVTSRDHLLTHSAAY